MPTVAPSQRPAVTPGLRSVIITPYSGDDPPDDDSIAFTVRYPEGWEYSGDYLVLDDSEVKRIKALLPYD